jgi:anhydro-N-acetylmuramic acid kinase
MDAWIRRHRGEPFDQGGSWAASGILIRALLTSLLNEPYMGKAPPKSTGKELFNLEWLDSLSAEYTAPPEDIQATLCHFTVETIAMGIAACSANGADEIFICGGGALNQHLMSLLEQKVPGTPIQSTAACGIDPMHVEAAAFAWLAHQTLNHLPGNLPDVTGASRPAILGGVYLP